MRPPVHLDLAARRLGGVVVEASGAFVAVTDHLLDPAPPGPPPLPGGRTDREDQGRGARTRQHREPGQWCVVRLGVPGVVREVVVETTERRGDRPRAFSLDGRSERGGWTALLPRTPLGAGARRRAPVRPPVRAAHVRLTTYPGGAVTRLRLRGVPVPDLRSLAGPGRPLDLAAAEYGGYVVGSSGGSVSTPSDLLLPHADAADTGKRPRPRRRRGPAHDRVVVRLAAAAAIDWVEIDTEVDTAHDEDGLAGRCTVEAHHVIDTDTDPGGDDPPRDGWTTVVGPADLRSHARHVFPVPGPVTATHVRFTVHSTAAVSRLRVFGRVTGEGWERFGLRFLNSLPAEHAAAELEACCAAPAWASRLAGMRPYRDVPALLAASDEVWNALPRSEWRRAFAAHPRIGERAGGWSRREQAGVRDADNAVLDALVEGNRAYEERFGHVFLVCASGRTARDMLAELRERLGNDAETETVVAADEQRKITRLRLRRLLLEVRP